MEKIKVTCKADESLPFQQIQDFQGELKARTQDDVDHLISSIENHGFSFPFFVWRQPDGTCSCLDGHGRIMALKQLEREGCEIPDLPVIYIDAADEAEARTKLIQINTVSGKFTDSGFRDLVKDIPNLDLSTYKYPELDLEKVEIELSVLAQAEASIQQSAESNWEEVFGGDALFGGMVPNSDFGTTTAPPYDAPSPAVTIATPVEEISGGVSAVLVAPDGPENAPEDEEPEVKELVVYCPKCGKSFIYQYK